MQREDQIILYRLLARLLAYPDKFFAENLRADVGKINLEVFDDARLPLAALVHELSRVSLLPLDQIQGEHTRLFINAYPHVPCPPYESAYREGELAGSSAEQVDALYCAWGLAVEADQVDHAGAELEFVAFLLGLGTLEALDAAQSFRAEHLERWLSQFAQDIVRESRLGFYRAVGDLLAATVSTPLLCDEAAMENLTADRG